MSKTTETAIADDDRDAVFATVITAPAVLPAAVAHKNYHYLSGQATQTPLVRFNDVALVEPATEHVIGRTKAKILPFSSIKVQGAGLVAQSARVATKGPESRTATKRPLRHKTADKKKGKKYGAQALTKPTSPCEVNR